MKLSKLINCNYDIEINKITDDSRKVEKNTLFVAIKGLTTDGHNYINKAFQNGAVAIISERKIECDVPLIVVENTNIVYNQLLNKFYDDVLSKLKLIGVTGTDGKTTVSEIIYQLLSNYDKCAYIGTNGIRCGELKLENDHTTPFPDDLFYAFSEFNKINCKYVSMECSSERLATEKLSELNFDVSIFTNLSRDHLDTHKTMKNYALAKAMMFEQTKGIGIVNIDDDYAKYFVDKAKSTITYSIINDKADIYAYNIVVEIDKLSFDITGRYGEHHIEANISGKYNVYNLMCAIVCLKYFGYDIDNIIENIKKIRPIEARQTKVDLGQNFNVIVDYAHTANALRNLLEYVSIMKKNRVIVVVGAGGSRDKRRMIDMANFCTENVDYSFFTIEDARYDDPNLLLAEMISEVKNNNYQLEVNRDIAIKKAINYANQDDLVLIIGKGMENYQVTNGKLVPRNNDVDEAKICLQELLNKKSANPVD